MRIYICMYLIVILCLQLYLYLYIRHHLQFIKIQCLRTSINCKKVCCQASPSQWCSEVVLWNSATFKTCCVRKCAVQLCLYIVYFTKVKCWTSAAFNTCCVRKCALSSFEEPLVCWSVIIKWVSALAFWYVVNLSKNLSICIIVFAIVLGVGWFVFVRGIRAMAGGQSLLR